MFRTAFALALVLPGLLHADDWPQFLGPNRESRTPDVIPAWKELPKPLWSVPVGEAHSSPVVADGVVYQFFKPKDADADALIALDAATGAKKWEKSYEREKFSPPFGKGPRGTPAVAGGKVFTLGNTGILAAWDVKTGEVLWKKDTLAEFKGKNLFFGVSTSPTVVGDTVVVMVGAKGAGIVGFKTENGETVWKASDDPASYASPLPIGTGKDAALAFLTGANLRAVSPAGKELWAVPFKDKLNESSTTPVVTGDLIVASSVTAGSVAYKLADLGSAEKPSPVWKNEALTCYFSTPVPVGKHLYMVTGAATLLKPAIHLRCVEAATGKIVWTQENVGKYHAALTRTGDDKLLMLDDAGSLILLDPSPEKYRELARGTACGPTWAHPAIANGVIYVRDENELKAYKLGK